MSRPNDALLAARSLLAGQPSSYDASLAHHAIGIVLRDRGDLRAAITELRRAIRLARASGRPEREADVQATLGIALAWTGRSRQGLAVLDQAVKASRGGSAGRTLMRRATVLYELGRFREAHDDLGRSLPFLRRAGDRVWEARSLMLRAHVYFAFGLPRRAAADFAQAEQLFAATGQEREYAVARHDRGLVALDRGDLPEALTYLDEAANRYETLGVTNPDLALDRCSALLAAGLAEEAAEETETALSLVSQEGKTAYRTADLLFAAGTAALAVGDPAKARERVRQAHRLYLTQGRTLQDARASLVLAEARYAAGEHTPALLRYAEEVAARLEASRAGETMQAHLLAGRIALSRGNMPIADQHLDYAARSRRRGPPLPRSVAWLARALQADARDDARAAVRRLLFWSERWRATAVAARSAPIREDKELAAELEALRSVSRLLGETEMAASRRNALERERRRLEAAVQARTRRRPGSHNPGEGGFNLEELVDELGPNTLIELVTVDSVLHVIVVKGRRVRLHTVGTIPERDVQMNRFVLRRLAHRPSQPEGELMLKHAGTRLEAALLGGAAADLGDGPVVVIPSAQLAAVPWTVMPSLGDRVVTVAPSAATWLRARRIRPPSRRRVALVVGPGLATIGAEVAPLRSRYPDAVVHGHGSATADHVLRALDGAWLAHIAAHSTFRADNPLFSSILLDDGPLTVHDFERLGRAPYQIVLAGCDSGVAAPVGADELLGLASSLGPLGAAGIVASVVPVNDVAAVPLMLALHDALQGGARLPEALLAMRRAAGDDPLARATAHSFLALGA